MNTYHLASRRSFVLISIPLIILAVLFSGCISDAPEEEKAIVQITKYMTDSGETYFVVYYDSNNYITKRIFKQQEEDIIIFSNKTRLVVENPNSIGAQFVLYINQSEFGDDCSIVTLKAKEKV